MPNNATEILTDETPPISLPEIEEASFQANDSSERVPPPDIIAYNEVRSCADLFRLYDSGKMEVQPDFQREVVWKKEERARFIDSLVKQLPIPSMCFSLDPKTQRWKVIDGLQRMTSIIDFLGTAEWRLAPLTDIHPLLQGNTNISLRTGDEASSVLYSSVENVTVPVTVIRCDYTKREHMRYLFTIFHRLNSGGVRLNNQEIRNCIYTGHFNDALKTFDQQNADWQVVKSRVWGSVNRFRSVEIILRVLAFTAKLESYDGNLADFLNVFMFENAELAIASTNLISERLKQLASVARHAIGAAPGGKLSLMVIEAMLVGINSNLDKLLLQPATVYPTLYSTMLKMASFAEGARYAVSSESNVKARLSDAMVAFAGDPV